MNLLEQLTNDMKTAMKAGDRQRLNAIRLLVSSLKYALVDEPELDNDGMVKILRIEAKKRRESIVAFRNAGREEQALGEEYELQLIEEYLPKQMEESEVRNVVKRIVNSEKVGANFGEMMKEVMEELKGKADGGMVARIVKETHEQNNKTAKQ